MCIRDSHGKGEAIRLSYVGQSPTLRQHSRPIYFKIDDPRSALAIGTTVKVILQTGDHVEGVVLPGAAVVRGVSGLPQVWAKTGAERSGWTLQPDFQYIWQPGGNVTDANPDNLLPRGGGAFGLRCCGGCQIFPLLASRCCLGGGRRWLAGCRCVTSHAPNQRKRHIAHDDEFVKRRLSASSLARCLSVTIRRSPWRPDPVARQSLVK